MSLDHLRRRLTRIEQHSGMGPTSLGRTPALWIVTRDDADRDRQLADLAAAGEYQPDRLVIDWRVVRPAERPGGPLQ